MSLFVIIALITAFTDSVSKLLQKHTIGIVDEYTVAWSRYIFAVPFLSLFLLYSGIPEIKPEFWPTILIISLVEIFIAVMFAKALKSADISKTIPFLAFGPIFVAFGSYILLHESLSKLQILAICFIVFGSYVLNIEKKNIKDLFAPFKVIWKEKGGLYLILLTIIWGFDIPLSKAATLASSPEFFTTVFFALTSIFFFPVFLTKSKNGFAGIKKNFRIFTATGIVTSIFLVSMFIAVKLGPTAVATGLFSLSILITVLLAGKFLKEKDILQSLIAAGIMTVGAILLTIA